MILMGVIGRPHGVQGLVKVNAFTETPEALEGYPLADKAGRRFALEWVGGNAARLSLVEGGAARAITDRNEAARLTNLELFTPRSALAEAEADEFYLADLVGLEARDAQGAVLGQVAAVHDFGGGTSLELAGAKPLIVPFTRASVPVVDVASGHVVIVPPDEVDAGGAEGEA